MNQHTSRLECINPAFLKSSKRNPCFFFNGHASSSSAFNQRRSGRNETHPIINDRHVPHTRQQPRFLSHKEQTSYITRQNMVCSFFLRNVFLFIRYSSPPNLSDRFHQQPTSPLHQLEALPVSLILSKKLLQLILLFRLS